MKLNFLNKGFVALGVMVSLLLSAPFAASVVLRLEARGRIFATAAEVPEREAALVLGAAAYTPTRLSAILQDRVDTAVGLYKANKVRLLIMSGAANEALAMGRAAISAGVPEQAIIEDPNGVSTLQSVVNTAKNYKDIVIVTQDYHLPRALFEADHFGLNAVGLTSDRRDYAKLWDFKKRELLATSKAVWDALAN